MIFERICLNSSFNCFWHDGIGFELIEETRNTNKTRCKLLVLAVFKNKNTIMKKLFTLVAGLFIMAVAIAADRRPVVTIDNSKNYKIVIDGKSYFGSNMTISVNNMLPGKHTIKVFEIKQNRYMKKEKLVDASTFQLGRNDVNISINRFGDISITEIRDRGRFERIDYDQHKRNQPDRRF
jgi:hypothetical protein